MLCVSQVFGPPTGKPDGTARRSFNEARRHGDHAHGPGDGVQRPSTGALQPGAGDTVRIFLSGRGVEIDQIEDEAFDVKDAAQKVLDAGGEFHACGTCLKLRNSEGSEVCPLSPLKDHYEIVRDSDRLITV